MILQELTVNIHTQFICKNLSLQFRPGKIWGILGPNGCGKTTLLHTLAGFHSVFQGSIFLHEKKIQSLTHKMIARSLGILFQEMNFTFPQTVWEFCLASRFPHLSYFKKYHAADEKIVRESLQKMELLPLKERLTTKLSGGEKRRLAIAALLAQTPDVYLLDEPVNHLDIKHQHQVLNYFTELARETQAKIVMTLHDINLAQQYCDYILLLFPQGKTLQGPVKEVLTEENLSRLYQTPLKKISDLYWQAGVN